MLLPAPAFGEGMPGSYCSLVEEALGTTARGARILWSPRGGCCGYQLCASSWLAPVGTAGPHPAPWLLSWQGDPGSGAQLSGAILVLAGASVSPELRSPQAQPALTLQMAAGVLCLLGACG